MKKIFLVTAVALSLAACGGAPSKPLTPEQKAFRAAKSDAWKGRETISSKGVAYEIAVMREKNLAMITVANPGQKHTPADMERAVRAYTGCGAEFNAGVLEFLGGWSKTNDLSHITGKAKNIKYWDVSLKC